MRVLHVIESMGRGGAERNLASLFRPLCALGVENHLATLWPGRSYDARVTPFVQRHEFNLTPGRAIPALPGLLRLARDVDVVHTQLMWANIVGRVAAALARRPSVTTLHTTAYEEANLAKLAPAMRRKTRVIREIDAITARAARHFFAVSPAVKDAHIRALRLSPDRIELAPCCLDTTEFDPSRAGDRGTVRAALGIAPDETAVLSVGRLVPSKRHCDAIAAVAVLAREARVRLYLAGAGPEEPSLRAQASRGRTPVTFLGMRDDVPRLLSGSDLFLFPSLYEGMPMALVEAMAMGVPCLCSDIPENRNLGGAACAYFPAQDVSAIVRGLRDLMADDDRRKRMGHEGRAAALRFADPAAAAARFVRSVRAVLGGA